MIDTKIHARIQELFNFESVWKNFVVIETPWNLLTAKIPDLKFPMFLYSSLPVCVSI